MSWGMASSSCLCVECLLSDFMELKYLYVLLQMSYSVIINDECSKGNLVDGLKVL